MAKICVIGDVNVDVVSLLQEPLQPNSDTETKNSLNLGGSPCNMSMWLAYVKADVTFMAAVGDDIFGAWIATELASGGLSTNELQKIPGASSGTCIILVSTDGQRTMLPDPGANLNFRLSTQQREIIEDSSVVVMSAYSFFRPETRELALDVVQVTKNCATRLVIDAASSSPIVEVGVQLVREYLANADLVLANEDEFDVLNAPDWITSISDLVLKLGAKGAKWIRFGIEECSVPAGSARAIDSTGAGDSFLAGLISVMSEHQDWYALSDDDRTQALIRGTEIAAMNVVSVGAGPQK